MSLETSARDKVLRLQEALHAKAKAEPQYRFYLLYDKLYREDVLQHAWRLCRSKGGAAGADELTFEQIEAYGVELWLRELAQELRQKTYQPAAVRRVYIPKPDGKLRPLGIPTIKDRVVQTAMVLVLLPIFEADMPDEQYAYRQERSAHDAVREAHRLVNGGHCQVVDVDLSGYFDSIPHAELMRSVARRICDGHMLRLIKLCLEMAVEEQGEDGRKRRHNSAKQTRRGTPQGAPLSPLLANIYMRRFIVGWKKLGWERRFNARVVNYADDMVILCRGSAGQAREAMQQMMTKLRLTVNENKTRVCECPKESFDFLGYTIGRCHRPRTGQPYLGTRPAKKRVVRFCAVVSETTARRTLCQKVKETVEGLNQKLRGWANYFCLGSVSKAYRAVDAHVAKQMRRWLCAKHEKRGHGTKRYSDEYLYGKLGLLRLSPLTHDLPWAKA